ncbi:cysteine-rich venom protein-like, partial [Elgaria multicarinata webbii]|uniref:cysteine-rich venom protein-like n=1 Tax=Elgaria multicarinata webbii TaxID=159646 RepID=UPI002FCD4476
LFRRDKKEHTVKEMLLSILLLPLAAVLHPSLGEDYSGIVSDLTEEMKTEILDNFNAVRRGVQPTASNMVKMTWSERAAETAEIWIRKCQPKRFPRDERMVDGILCGETRMQATYTLSWSEVINTWNKKASNFQYGVGAINTNINIYFYTQMIWYNSHKVGCSLAFCNDNKYEFVYVCLYCPVGNIAEKVATPYKEGPSCEDCPHSCENKLCTQPCEYYDENVYCEQMIRLFACEHKVMQDMCKATCRCPSGIM